MRPVLSLALLRALSPLLPLAICGWALVFPNFASSENPVHISTSKNRGDFHLQIHPDGRVDGTQPQTVYSALLIKPVRAPNVMIIGAKTELNLCMHCNGSLFGSPSFSDEDCVFKHVQLENRRNVYKSRKHKFLVSLGKVKGQLRADRNTPPLSQFLSRDNQIPLSEIYPLRYQQNNTRDGSSPPCIEMSPGKMQEEHPGEAGIDRCSPID